MEQKRLLLAIGLSFLVFFLWSVAFAPKPTDKPMQQTQGLKAGEKESDKKPVAASESLPAEKNAVQPIAAVEEAPSDRAAREIVVETPMFRMTLSEKGGAVTSMVLNPIGKPRPPIHP